MGLELEEKVHSVDQEKDLLSLAAAWSQDDLTYHTGTTADFQH
jgi:hypothetical protein